MNSDDVNRWFGEYLEAFAACGRHEKETRSLLAFYDVPIVFTSDEGVFGLTSEDQVVATVQRQLEGMRLAGYTRTEVVHSEVAVINAKSALYRGTFSRQRDDGTEIGRLTATYLVIDGSSGRRIAMLAVHSAPT
jgi:hypothetical protein